MQLIKNQTISGNVAFWVATGLSVVGGIIAAFAGGIPANAADWAVLILAAVGGVNVFYRLFKAVGITNKWLDALGEVDAIKSKDGGGDGTKTK